MLTFYHYDIWGFYTHSWEYSMWGPVPKRATQTPPPELTGTQVAAWQGNHWVVLEEMPEFPEAAFA